MAPLPTCGPTANPTCTVLVPCMVAEPCGETPPKRGCVSPAFVPEASPRLEAQGRHASAQPALGGPTVPSGPSLDHSGQEPCPSAGLAEQTPVSWLG